MATNEVVLGGLTVATQGGQDLRWYQQRKTHEEAASLLYPLIKQAGFRQFLDVGSNYGFVAMLAARQGLRVVCIEADPRLIPYIEGNFARNDLPAVPILHAAAGRESGGCVEFSLNPNTTLDNRVEMGAWSRVRVPRVRLDDVVVAQGLDTEPLFIKIDTQGYEEHVLDGLSELMSERDDWMIKMEFAPDWLRSQGTDAVGLLRRLAERFDVAEAPERIPYNTPSLDVLFACRIAPEQAKPFLDYVVSLNARGLGWVDLLVRPKTSLARASLGFSPGFPSRPSQPC